MEKDRNIGFFEIRKYDDVSEPHLRIWDNENMEFISFPMDYEKLGRLEAILTKLKLTLEENGKK